MVPIVGGLVDFVDDEGASSAVVGGVVLVVAREPVDVT